MRRALRLLAPAAFALACLLTLCNLGTQTLWDDEVHTVFIARQLARTGELSGSDDRHVLTGTTGRDVTHDLKSTAPPLQFHLSALGMRLFGQESALAARLPHALLGLLSLLLFAALLKDALPHDPDLRRLTFVLACTSAQALLYFRAARYCTPALFCFLLAAWSFGRRERGPRHLYDTLFITAVSLAFLNHYLAGPATLAAVSGAHLTLERHTTRRRDWLLLAAAAAVAGSLTLAHLSHAGFFGAADRFSAFTFHDTGAGPATGPVFRLLVLARDLVLADWLSWWGAAVLLGLLLARPHTLESSTRRGLARLSVLALAYAIPVQLASLQPAWLLQAPLDLRFFLPALPLLLTLKGALVYCALRRNQSTLAWILLAVFAFTTLGTWPFHFASAYLRRAPNFHLLHLAREVWSPPPSTARKITGAIDAPDGARVAVFPPRNPYALSFAAKLVWHLGDRHILCDYLEPDTHLDPERLAAFPVPPYLDACRPDWVVAFTYRAPADPFRDPATDLAQALRRRHGGVWELRAAFRAMPYERRSPQLNQHDFSDLQSAWRHVFVFRRRIP